MVILDTCAVIEIAKVKPGLSSKGLNIIEKGSYILSISFAEIACKIKLKKVDIGIQKDILIQQVI